LSTIILGGIRFVAWQKYEVNWYSLLHAFTTGCLSAVCMWLNQFGAMALTGTSEPLGELGAILCQGPLTMIH
jgi:hypothetical protein